MDRRRFLEATGLAVLAGSARIPAQSAQVSGAVPNSSGTEPPKLKVPVNACDCHHHIFDVARFPPLQPGPEIDLNARVQEYRLLQRRIGTVRNVVVTGRSYVTDNRITLDAIAQLGPNARGVAVIDPTVTDAELAELARAGIRGIRFSLHATAQKPVSSIDMIEPLAKRIHARGWHVQISTDADQIFSAADLWDRLPTDIVFDNLGQLPPRGMKHPTFGLIRRLLDGGRTWVKLNTSFRDGAPTYAGVTPVAEAFIRAAPQRMLWGSNWPHPFETNKPNDAALLDLFAQWAPSERLRRQILVENPEVLYGFPKS